MSQPDDSQPGPAATGRGSVDLTIALTPRDDGSCLVKANSAVAAGTETVHLPELDPVTTNAPIHRAMRSAAETGLLPPEIVTDVTQIGGQLFRAVFTGGVLDAYRSAREAAESDHESLRILLSMDPALLGLPWEALLDEPLFLATQRDTSVLRVLPSSGPLRPVLVRGQVRILGVSASPTDQEALDTDEERRRVEEQLAPVLSGGLARLDWLEPATVDSLESALERDYHVLHYVGHSALTASGEGVLILEREDGTGHPVTGSLLANMIGRRTSIRLAVLNSCASAAVVAGDPFSGIATKLVALGIPAVVAMQYAIGDAAAITFGSSMYRALIDQDRQVEDAVADGRRDMLTAGHELDWLAPVLFVQGSGTRLFDLSLIGWYTLDSTRPSRGPDWGRPGFLGLTLTDPIERAMRLLGPDFDTYSEENRVHRCWSFQDQSRVCVTEIDGSIMGLSASVDGDNPGPLRISLPYGLCLGESRMKDTLAIERTSKPRKHRMKPELLLMEDWTYTCPDSGEGWIEISFGTMTAAGREYPTPEWFSWDMDVSDRLITSCSVEPRKN